jgi:REP element-mobilizing transposase RayT/DNA-binding CsgD family transcriptional regulator
MPRNARLDAPGALHHIIARGIERREIFCDDEDRNDFLRRLGEILTESQTHCYAWTLIPNHFHLLIKTGDVALATVMRRHRNGHLFQNRYKSILCQEEVYLLELVRYTHLNPLRAGIIKTVEDLDRYRYCGHSCLMGNSRNDWQENEAVLKLFGKRPGFARRTYRAFVEKGMEQGRRPDLIGGGLLRSAGGWQAVGALRKAGIHQKSDERMLGDGDFVEHVLLRAKERLHRKYGLASKGIGFEQLAQWVSELTAIPLPAMAGPGKQRKTVRARSILCFLAVNGLGLPLADLAARLGISLPTVSVAVQRGGEIVDREKLDIAVLECKI